MSDATAMAKALTAARGGRKFALAILSGDVADNAEQVRRRAVCQACPTRVRKQLPGMTGPADWCGEPLVEVKGKSCGCLLAGLTAVASSKCSQSRW